MEHVRMLVCMRQYAHVLICPLSARVCVCVHVCLCVSVCWQVRVSCCVTACACSTFCVSTCMYVCGIYVY